MERLGWRSQRANMLAAMRRTGHGLPVCSQTTIIPSAPNIGDYSVTQCFCLYLHCFDSWH